MALPFWKYAVISYKFESRLDNSAVIFFIPLRNIYKKKYPTVYVPTFLSLIASQIYHQKKIFHACLVWGYNAIIVSMTMRSVYLVCVMTESA